MTQSGRESTGRGSRPRQAAHIVGAMAIAALATWNAHRVWDVWVRSDANYRYFRKLRVQAVTGAAAQVAGDFVLLAGDSHAERTFLPSLCGLPVFDAGIGGATAQDTAALLAALPATRRARVAIVIVGTNDAMVGPGPVDPAVLERYRTGLASIVDGLRPVRTVFLGIPALRPGAAPSFSPAASAAFVQEQIAACRTGACLALPVMTAAAPDGLDQDGVHRRDYGSLIEAASPQICAEIR